MRVECALNRLDLESIARLQRILQQDFHHAGLGSLVLTDGEFPHNDTPSGSAHHMGTTRMHHDPRKGVIDPKGRVHGMKNLYVTGGSLFPTGGYANPTLTIVALAVALADHLKGLLSSPPREVPAAILHPLGTSHAEGRAALPPGSSLALPGDQLPPRAPRTVVPGLRDGGGTRG